MGDWVSSWPGWLAVVIYIYLFFWQARRCVVLRRYRFSKSSRMLKTSSPFIVLTVVPLHV